MADKIALREMFPEADATVLSEVASVSASTEEAIDRLLELGFVGGTISSSGERFVAGQRMDARQEIQRTECKPHPTIFAPHVDVPPSIVVARHPAPPAPPYVRDELERVSETVALLVDDAQTRRLADLHGLVCEPVSMEDVARSANSVYGPCVSDLTLVVRDRMLPLIRTPNFSDLSFDVPLDAFTCPVGNEQNGSDGRANNAVSLKHFLQHIDDYTGGGSHFGSLYAARDTHALCSLQYCMLPVVQGAETSFDLRLFNHQSSARSPSVLALVISENGTSIFLVRDSENGQRLCFNNGGYVSSFIARRLSDDRRNRGVADMSSPLTAAEKQANMLFVVQIPLVTQQCQPAMIQRRHEAASRFDSLSAAPAPMMAGAKFSEHRAEQSVDDVEDAILSVGAKDGRMPSFVGSAFTRDQRFPIRVTVQFYKATSSGHIDSESMSSMAQTLKESPLRQLASFSGSLVLSKDGRPTAPQQERRPNIPPWWDNWWATNSFQYPFSREQCETMLFSDNRFSTMGMSEAEPAIHMTLFAFMDAAGPVRPQPIICPRPPPPHNGIMRPM